MCLFRRRKNKRKSAPAPYTLDATLDVDNTIDRKIIEQTKRDLLAASQTNHHNWEKAPRRESTRKAYIDSEDEDIDVAEISEIPLQPYRLRDPEAEPPSYKAYDKSAGTKNPDFDEAAVMSALRVSRPPKVDSPADDEGGMPRVVEQEQGQYLSSITYGDQRNRGLDELTRFQEDLVSAVGQETGLTKEEIERRRHFAILAESVYFDGDSDADGAGMDSEDDDMVVADGS